ncbi:MAG: RNA polymerase subunit sigma-70 [Brevundimonas sp.]|uniref:Sigma-70 family RNA polymerase sigma factor n=1 Tax=Brevundimonas albigilva TaxID=1312364 RepID=A0ABY4SN57_9CAUL|nr:MULTISPECIES: sigma-70 family RNA polymerase sigma factor [Brevundimonas]PZU58708.1 MAG: RNA polymerase subunit sigma-70 [Brevundimonas sp.]URI15674.1 sigma-70 family RNA polymerase sigma factor [Brevundimonas albigilva]
MVDREAELKRLMLRGLDGDAAAWRALLSEMRGALTPFFKRRLIGCEADAEDLVQDCLIAIHAKRATYDRSLPFTAWAYAIARYKLIDHFRRLGRRPDVPLEEASVLLAEHTVEDGVIRRDLKTVLSILPLRQRRLIEDVRIGGFSLAEAAARNGFTEGAAKVSVHRSMKTLSASVKTDED